MIATIYYPTKKSYETVVTNSQTSSLATSLQLAEASVWPHWGSSFHQQSERPMKTAKKTGQGSPGLVWRGWWWRVLVISKTVWTPIRAQMRQSTSGRSGSCVSAATNSCFCLLHFFGQPFLRSHPLFLFVLHRLHAGREWCVKLTGSLRWTVSGKTLGWVRLHWNQYWVLVVLWKTGLKTALWNLWATKNLKGPSQK